MGRVVGWLGGWARRSNERATANARAAATTCSRRRLERAEVEAYLAQVVTSATVGVHGAVVIETDAVAVH